MSGKTTKLAEVASARIRFGVTLQSLVDKKGDGNVSSDEEVDTQAEMQQSEPAVILSPTKRTTAKVSRKRKRKDDEAIDGSQYHHTYVMKLFDRSVDLAQFDEEAALYPVCRAWLKNQPHNRSLGTRDRTPTPDPEPPTNSEEEVEEEEIFPNVFKLPDPIKADPDIIHDYRIPMPIPQPDEELNIDADQDMAPPPEHLLLSHMERWKIVRQSWRDAGFMNELRFSDSMNVLREMFEQQMKESP